MNPSLNSVWGRRLIAALLTWLVPFLIAVPFYGKNGTLLIDLMLFKSIMIVVATITAAMLMFWFFRAVMTAYTREAVITGLVWLVVTGYLTPSFLSVCWEWHCLIISPRLGCAT